MNADFLEKIISIFLYQETVPFVFSGLEFWVFFGVFLSLFSLVYQRVVIRNWVILIFSLYFYYRSSGAAFFLLMLVISQDFYLGKRIQLTSDFRKKRLLLTISVVSNLAILAYFKYAHFLVGIFNDLFGWKLERKNWLALLIPPNDYLSFDQHQIVLPIGISFFVFQSLSYTIDCYRNHVQRLDHWQDYALFVSFFPQLVAGPIVRAKDFISQMFFPYHLDRQDFGKGLFLIIGGLVKKIVISDVVSTQLVDRVFDQPALASAPEAWLAYYGYGIQIFCDFSGYTDIAIGMALLLGFQLNPNFDQPYQSLNITEFWRRWHISLSVWLKDYLYIPLGGNRKGEFRTYINLLITMLLGGLWHGASLKFVVWGGLHGIALALHKLWIRMGLSGLVPSAIAWLITFHFALACWIPFRARDFQDSVSLFEKMVQKTDLDLWTSVFTQYALAICLIFFGFGLQFLKGKWKQEISHLFSRQHIVIQGFICVLLFIIMYQFKTTENQPFIYFQF